MTATACALAVLLAFEAATTPAAKDECELADHRCKAVLFEGRAANAANAEHRAVYLFSAHKLYLRLFDQSGDLRDLCAARRALDASLAIEGQPASLRAKSETMRAELLAREQQQTAQCGNMNKRRRPKPANVPLVARSAEPPGPTNPDPARPLLAASAVEPGEASSPRAIAAAPPASASSRMLDLLGDADLPSTQPSTELLPVAARPIDAHPAPTPHPGRGLVIAGGATLGVGGALAVGAGLTVRRMNDTRQAILALSDQIDGYATADQAASDAALRHDHAAQQHQRLALAIGSGATIVVAMILAGVGGRRLARATSQTAFIPAPGGVAFRLRF